MDRSPGSSSFRTLVAASSLYGLTKGTYNSDTIELTELGLSLARPRDDSEREEAIRKAALTPDLFARLYAQLDQQKWPTESNLSNVLIRDFEVAPEHAKEAGAIAKANAEFAGLLQETRGGAWLTLNADLRRRADDAVVADSEQDPTDEDPVADVEDTETDEPVAAAPARGIRAVPEDDLRDHVFISHSKNPAILEQIKTILDFGQFVPVVAEEEETSAIPVPEKVLASMRRCGSAVINVSADAPERRDDGTFGINQNVLIEIGVAFALYDRRVVLLVDKRVDLPSNLQGLYRSEYEGDELGWTAGMKLQKALANFRGR
jgi:predicted nucleotide-binding protein